MRVGSSPCPAKNVIAIGTGCGRFVFQIPRVVVPAGLNDIVVEPQYALNEAKTDYIPTIAPNTPKTKLAHPMPIAITFFAGQGDEPTLIKIGTAYESATHHRTPPPAFGPVVVHAGQTALSR